MLADTAPLWSGLSLWGGSQARSFSRGSCSWSFAEFSGHPRHAKSIRPLGRIPALKMPDGNPNLQNWLCGVCVPGRRLRWGGIRHKQKYPPAELRQNHGNETSNGRSHNGDLWPSGPLVGSSWSQQAGGIGEL